MSNIPFLSITNLSHKYETQYALKNVSFDLTTEGQIVGLLGSNGAGKSTMMIIICGALTQSSGTVKINGYDNLKDRLHAKSLIGFLPQKPPLHIDLTVKEYLNFAATLRGITGKERTQAVSKVLDRCEIAHFKNRVIKNLSGGYQQRVGIAQAIIHNPSIIIFDEPTNGLDPNQILEIRKLIQDIAHGRLVMLSTHILQEVQALCDQIIMIEHGEFVFSGTMQEFNNTLKSNSVVMRFDQCPPISELESLHFCRDITALDENTLLVKLCNDAVNGQNSLIKAAVSHDWKLNEIYKEKIDTDQIFKHFSKR